MPPRRHVQVEREGTRPSNVAARTAGRTRFLARVGRTWDVGSSQWKLPADLRQHDLRHRRVTTWLAEGKSPALVQKATGHSDLATTMGYAHLLDHDVLALVADDEDRELRALAGG